MATIGAPPHSSETSGGVGALTTTTSVSHTALFQREPGLLCISVLLRARGSQLQQLLAEVAAVEQSPQRLRRSLESLQHIFFLLETAFAHPASQALVGYSIVLRVVMDEIALHGRVGEHDVEVVL